MSENLRFYNQARSQWYVATSILGRGGQGVVWSGTFGILRVAIKVQSDFKAWQLEQSIHLACIGHPFIVAAYDQFVAQDGSMVLVMERGECSAQHLVDRGARFTPMQVCRIGVELASALETIHAQGIRHRDITLKNVLHFGNGKFKLGDFGIARRGMAADELAMTQVGTPGWFPPEVLMGQGSTPSSDVYQLGLVLLSLLLGRHIIPSTYTRQQMSNAILNAVPRLTAEQAVSTHGETASIIRNMLPRTPGLRHTSATGVRLAFEAQLRTLQARVAVGSIKPKPAVNGLTAITGRVMQPAAVNGLLALGAFPKPQRPPSNGLQGFGVLAKLQRSPSNGLLGVGTPSNIQPFPLNGLGHSALSNLHRPLSNGLFGLGAPPNIQPSPLNKLGHSALSNLQRPPIQGMFANAQFGKSNAGLGGLLGLGALAALASGDKQLGGLLGLGAVAAFASAESAKSSS